MSDTDGKKPDGNAQPPAAKLPPPAPTPGGKPAPKHPGFVTVTVDGKELVAKPGEIAVADIYLPATPGEVQSVRAG